MYFEAAIMLTSIAINRSVYFISFDLISRSTPCPHVKHGDEWGEPTNCESGDGCPYCHTRTEQQFHPEVCCNIIVNKSLKVSWIDSSEEC